MTATYPASLNGYEPSPLRAALEAAGGSLKSLTVLAPQNDPFRVDTPAGHRDGAWLANTIERLGITGHRHLRGLHYILIGQPKPNGEPYTNTDSDWTWLASVAKAARWNGYVRFDRIIDQRNDAPEIVEWTPPLGIRHTSVYTNTDFQLPTDLTPWPHVGGLDPGQPNHLALVGEKSSLRNVLGSVANRYSADLYLPTGEMSDTMAHTMAQSAVRDGRPLVVFYFSDCDPAGWQMPISLARKLQALKAVEFDSLEFEVHRVGLIPEQVRLYDLPSTPLKDTERRADKWEAAMGVQQTEIDALAALQSNLLREIANDAIGPYYDNTLGARVREAEREWRQRAQQAITEQIDGDRWSRHTDKLARVGQLLTKMMESVRRDTNGIKLPPPPEQFEPQLDGDHPVPLCNSKWDFAEQCSRLIASKNYDNDEMGERP